MDHLEAINDDLTANGHERAGVHRWVKQTPQGQLQAQAGAEVALGRMAVFTGRFQEEGVTYTVGGSWSSSTHEYTALMETIPSGGEPRTHKLSGARAKLSDVLRELESAARRETEYAL